MLYGPWAIYDGTRTTDYDFQQKEQGYRGALCAGKVNRR